MKALIQRVSMAEVWIAKERFNRIETGLLVLLGIEKQDAESDNVVQRMGDKLLSYRVFADQKGHMNLNVQQVSGEILLVSQFTLVADTHKGLRPSFSASAPPEVAEPIYDNMVAYLTQSYPKIKTGQFAAEMSVGLVNEGPVTFLLQV